MGLVHLDCCFGKKLIKKYQKNDTLHVISASPNRYDPNLNFSKKFKIDDLRVIEYKVKVFNHKERIILKSKWNCIFNQNFVINFKN